MTQPQKNALKVVVPFIATIFLAGIAWNKMQGQVDGKVDTSRYVTDSVHRDGVTTIILQNQVETNSQLREINQRMLEVCIALKGRAGCR